MCISGEERLIMGNDKDFKHENSIKRMLAVIGIHLITFLWAYAYFRY